LAMAPFAAVKSSASTRMATMWRQRAAATGAVQPGLAPTVSASSRHCSTSVLDIEAASGLEVPAQRDCSAASTSAATSAGYWLDTPVVHSKQTHELRRRAGSDAATTLAARDNTQTTTESDASCSHNADAARVAPALSGRPGAHAGASRAASSALQLQWRDNPAHDPEPGCAASRAVSISPRDGPSAIDGLDLCRGDTLLQSTSLSLSLALADPGRRLGTVRLRACGVHAVVALTTTRRLSS
jgi:hypothetical protein